MSCENSWETELNGHISPEPCFSFRNRASLPVSGDTGAGKLPCIWLLLCEYSDARDRATANTVAVLLYNTLFLCSKLKMQIVGFDYYVWLSMKSSCGIQSISGGKTKSWFLGDSSEEVMVSSNCKSFQLLLLPWSSSFRSGILLSTKTLLCYGFS